MRCPGTPTAVQADGKIDVVTVAEHAGQDVGVLQSWSLEICIENVTLFADGFESGTTSAWSAVVP